MCAVTVLSTVKLLEHQLSITLEDVTGEIGSVKYVSDLKNPERLFKLVHDTLGD